MDKQLFLETAIESAVESGKILMEYFGNDNQIEFKEDNSPVTIADKKSEKQIIESISKKLPGHSFLGEESGTTDNKSEYLWVIDPLDGTSNFSNEIPYFCISIALLYKKEPIVATILDPIHNDLFTAISGEGAFLNNQKLFLKDVMIQKTRYVSVVYTRSPKKKVQIDKIFSNLNPPEYRLRNMGAAALELAYVSAGKLQGIVINGNNPWDVCAGILLVKEAGGIVSDFNGKSWSFQSENIVAAPQSLHTNLLKLI